MKNRASAEALTLLHPLEAIRTLCERPNGLQGVLYYPLTGKAGCFVLWRRTAAGKHNPLHCPFLTDTTICDIIRNIIKKRLCHMKASGVAAPNLLTKGTDVADRRLHMTKSSLYPVL